MAKTLIFKNWDAFYKREDKTINGVNQDHADANPEWEREKGNEGCWNSLDCSGCSRCLDCSGCSGCLDCSGCSDCEHCASLKNGKDVKEFFEPGIGTIPVIPNIHQTLLEAVSKENALNMMSWHESEEVNEQGAYCGTTHCRAGWIVALAGKAGRRLEAKTNTLFAAQQIYKASSKITVSPPRFFEGNTQANVLN